MNHESMIIFLWYSVWGALGMFNVGHYFGVLDGISQEKNDSAHISLKQEIEAAKEEKKAIYRCDCCGKSKFKPNLTLTLCGECAQSMKAKSL